MNRERYRLVGNKMERAKLAENVLTWTDGVEMTVEERLIELKKSGESFYSPQEYFIKKDILEWVRRYMIPMKTKSFTKAISSYGLKHAAERMLDRYVSDIEMQFAMHLNGFYGKNNHGIQYKLEDSLLNGGNVYYRISSPKMRYLREVSHKWKVY